MVRALTVLFSFFRGQAWEGWEGWETWGAMGEGFGGKSEYMYQEGPECQIVAVKAQSLWLDEEGWSFLREMC